MSVEGQKRLHVVVTVVLEAGISDESVHPVSVRSGNRRNNVFAHLRLIGPGAPVRRRRSAELEDDGLRLPPSSAVDGDLDRRAGGVLVCMSSHLVRSRSQQPPELPELGGQDVVVDPLDLNESLKAFETVVRGSRG